MSNTLVSESIVKRLSRGILPERLYGAGKRVFLSWRVRSLRDRCSRQAAIGSKVREVLSSVRFQPDQKDIEIEALLELLQTFRPRMLCEIGGRIGGSLALFAQVAAPDARILSVDIDYRHGQKEALACFAGPRQEIRCMAADSHLPETLRAVTDWLEGQPLDFLFIDGDHSLSGVTDDFTMYSPLVRHGGLIAFHDIVPDSRTRRGIASGSDVGQVPIFWSGLKARPHRTEEYVEDWNQDGFGIGVVHWDGGAS